jgi:hypothetical protein
MNIHYLLQLLSNRLSGLQLAKSQAFQAGDLDRINALDTEIREVESTVSKLNLLATIEQTALATNTTEASVVQNGVDASFFNPTVLNDATRTLLNYDITPYATDPNHEIRIQSILEKMGFMDSVDQIDAYMKNAAPTTPLTGDMVLNASIKYAVDTRLILAIMEQDSAFGTLGVATRTFNPGNVGNTGSAERTYPSWEAGVDAVALWLNNNRRIATVEEIVSQKPSYTETQIEEVEPAKPAEKVTKKLKVKEVKDEPVVEEIVNTPETPVVEETPSSTEPVVDQNTGTTTEPVTLPEATTTPTTESTSTESVSTE